MSARLRLTLSYAGFLLVAGVALLAIVYYLLRFVPDGDLQSSTGEFVPDRTDLLRAFWPRALQVMAGLAVVGLVGGWFLAGRMLRPLQRIDEVARRVAAGSLAHRVELTGPRDEFRLLAETFDGMLDRIQDTVDEQGRFAANASHELRTPYAIQRALLDVAIADPDGRDVDELLRQLLETNRRGTDIVEALLTLSAVDHGMRMERVPVDIAEVASAAIAELAAEANAAEVVVISELGEGDIDGDPRLVRQLLANLIANGIRHNTGPGGTVRVVTRTARGGGVEIGVTNTGPIIDADRVATLTEPFVRGEGRVAADRGSGLGLAIVARVAHAHGAALRVEAVSTGGLDVQVHFP